MLIQSMNSIFIISDIVCIVVMDLMLLLLLMKMMMYVVSMIIVLIHGRADGHILPAVGRRGGGLLARVQGG